MRMTALPVVVILAVRAVAEDAVVVDAPVDLRRSVWRNDNLTRAITNSSMTYLTIGGGPQIVTALVSEVHQPLFDKPKTAERTIEHGGMVYILRYQYGERGARTGADGLTRYYATVTALRIDRGKRVTLKATIGEYCSDDTEAALRPVLLELLGHKKEARR